MNIRFAGHRVIVTGGSGYLGSAVVDALLAAEAVVVVPCEHERELERVGAKAHPRVAAFGPVDLTDEASVERFFDQAGSDWGAGAAETPWGLVNTAGGFTWKPLVETDAALATEQWRMNALSCLLATRVAAKRMIAGKAGGRIVNVSARPALEPRTGANMSAYTGAKAAVAAMTAAWAEELIAHRILVNAVVPSIMDTPPNRKAMPDADFAKWAKVSDVAATIAFLVSPQNAVTRGGLVPVYGGS